MYGRITNECNRRWWRHLLYHLLNDTDGNLRIRFRMFPWRLLGFYYLDGTSTEWTTCIMNNSIIQLVSLRSIMFNHITNTHRQISNALLASPDTALTFLAAYSTASLLNTPIPFNRDWTTIINCWNAYGWKLTRLRPSGNWWVWEIIHYFTNNVDRSQ